MMEKEKTQMQSSSVTAVIWLCIRVSSIYVRFFQATNYTFGTDCYGVPYIPEGQWLCRKCTVEPENPVVRFQKVWGALHRD